MASGAMLTGLWVLYILLASLQAKGSINAALVADSALCPYIRHVTLARAKGTAVRSSLMDEVVAFWRQVML